jgi:hypothetical protein
MKVRILPETGGISLSLEGGKEFDLPKVLAQGLIDQGLAEPVESGKRKASSEPKGRKAAQ